MAIGLSPKGVPSVLPILSCIFLCAGPPDLTWSLKLEKGKPTEAPPSGQVPAKEHISETSWRVSHDTCDKEYHCSSEEGLARHHTG
jgi:hypothetical protein